MNVRYCYVLFLPTANCAVTGLIGVYACSSPWTHKCLLSCLVFFSISISYRYLTISVWSVRSFRILPRFLQVLTQISSRLFLMFCWKSLPVERAGKLENNILLKQKSYFLLQTNDLLIQLKNWKHFMPLHYSLVKLKGISIFSPHQFHNPNFPY